MTADRKDYMRKYRAAQKLKLVPEQFVTVPEHVTDCTNMLRTDEQLDNVGVHATVTNPALTVPEPARTVPMQVRAVPEHVRAPETVFKHPLSRYLSTGALAIFIILNTAFLIHEQVSFYELKGEGSGYAMFVACLTEVAALMLSFFGTWYRRPLVFALLIPTLALIFFVIFLGLQRKEGTAQQTIRAVKLLENEIALLREQKDDLEKRIDLASKDSMKQTLYRIKSSLETKTEELRKITVPYTDGMEIWVLAALRVLAIFWNIAFASLLAFIWKGKNTIKLFGDAQ